jgi:guanylate kinase
MADSVKQQLLDKVKSYHAPASAVELLSQHKPLIIAGVTASGKATVTEYIQKISDWRHVVTHTTRPPREGEENGKDYWFVSEDEMLRLIEGNKFIEVKNIHNQQISGTSISAYKKVVEAGQKPLLITDVQGIEDITKSVPGLKAAFLLPPSFEAWMQRLDRRGRMSHVERLRRLKSASQEIIHAMNSLHFNLYINADVNLVAKAILDEVSLPAEQHHNRELAERLIEHAKAY